jgi:hypothetical protein
MNHTSPSPRILYPEWQVEYLAALVEVNPQTLLERVTAAETIILNRLQAVSHNADCNTERQAMADALFSLRVLKREKWYESRSSGAEQSPDPINQDRHMLRL